MRECVLLEEEKHQTILWQISTSYKIHLHITTYAELCCLDGEALVNCV